MTSVSSRSWAGAPDDRARPAESAIRPAVVALAATAALVESALLLTLPITLGSACTVHAFVVAGAWLCRPVWRGTRHGALLLMVIAAFGPLGGFGMLLAAAVERHQALRSPSVDERYEMLFPPAEPDAQSGLWRRIGQRAHDRRRESDVTSFLDILTFGSVPQRQTAIGIMAQQFKPEFSPALRAAVRDEHNVIRVQAATAIARLEQQLFERTVALEATVARDASNASAVLALAGHFDDQAFAGLFDPTREAMCRTRAAELFARYLEVRPVDQAVELRLARLLLRQGRATDAEPRLRRLAEAGHRTARLWLMECLFTQGRYEDVRAVAGGWDVAGDDKDGLAPPGVRATVDLWSGSRPAA
jgi:hypothetical protein